MTPKRLRLIAGCITNYHFDPASPGAKGIAAELTQHADELDAAETIRLKEPGGTVFTDLERQRGKRS